MTQSLETPGKTQRVTRVLILGVVVFAVIGMTVASRERSSEARQYREYQRQIARWDSLAVAESLRAVRIGAEIADSARVTVARLTAAEVTRQRAAGGLTFVPPVLLRERAEARDRMTWAQNNARQARSQLRDWIWQAGAAGRDTLGVRH